MADGHPPKSMFCIGDHFSMNLVPEQVQYLSIKDLLLFAGTLVVQYFSRNQLSLSCL